MAALHGRPWNVVMRSVLGERRQQALVVVGDAHELDGRLAGGQPAGSTTA